MNTREETYADAKQLSGKLHFGYIYGIFMVSITCVTYQLTCPRIGSARNYPATSNLVSYVAACQCYRSCPRRPRTSTRLTSWIFVDVPSVGLCSRLLPSSASAGIDIRDCHPTRWLVWLPAYKSGNYVVLVLFKFNVHRSRYVTPELIRRTRDLSIYRAHDIYERIGGISNGLVLW